MKLKFIFLLITIIATSQVQAQQVFPGHEPPTPAFPGQTRAPIADQSAPVDLTVVKDDLFLPWGLAALPNGNMLMTEMTGRLSLVKADGSVLHNLSGLPPVRGYWYMGLMDVILHPNFEDNRLVYFSYFAPPQDEDGNGIHETTAQWGDAYTATTALHDE